MEWTKQNNSHNHFLRIARGVLEAVAKLRVSWCVAIPLNGSNFVGWVSENYLALARLARWFFSIIPYLRQGPEYKDPERCRDALAALQYIEENISLNAFYQVTTM